MSGIEIALAIGAVAGVASSAMSMMAQAEQADAQEKLSAYKISVDEKNAAMASAQSRAEAEDARRDSKRRLSEIRATYGASGIDLAGSPLDVLSDAASEGELGAQRIEYEGKVRAEGYRSDAAIGAMERSRAKEAKSSAYASGAVNMLFGAASGGLKGYQVGKALGY